MLVEALLGSLAHIIKMGLAWQGSMNEQGDKLLGRSIHGRIGRI